MAVRLAPVQFNVETLDAWRAHERADTTGTVMYVVHVRGNGLEMLEREKFRPGSDSRIWYVAWPEGYFRRKRR